MKKISIAAVLFMLAALSVYATETDRQEDSGGDFISESIGNTMNVRITGYSGSKTELRIPSVIRRTTVVAIGDRAFYDRKFTGVVIPSGVILIGNEAFSRNEITSITIGTNVFLQDNSFDSGFGAFYQRNGRRAGTYVLNNGTWSIKAVTDTPPEEIEDKKPETAKKKGVEMEPYFNFSTGIGLWDYGPSTLVPRPSLYFGMSMEIDKLKICLSAGGGGFLGIAYPAFDDFGIMYGFFFGSQIEFYFSDSFGLGLGGGMTRFNFTTVNSLGENSFFPFVELNFMLGKKSSLTGICFRYYVNDSDKFYNKFYVGITIGESF